MTLTVRHLIFLFFLPICCQLQEEKSLKKSQWDLWQIFHKNLLTVPLEIISIVMAVQQILTPKMFLHSLAVEQFLHVKYFEFYSQLMIVKNLSEIPL